jgi:Flp pilus assembly protein TadB
MSGDEVKSEVSNESLRVQLAELNNRSRFYSGQIWQLPLAYLVAVGLVLAQLKDGVLVIGFLAAGVLGVLLLIHLFGIDDGRRRATRHLQRLERELNLTQTAEEKRGYTAPLLATVALATVSFFVAAVVLWCRRVA